MSSPSVAETPALWEEIVRTTLLDHKRRYPQIDSVMPWGEANQASSGNMTPSQFYPFYRAGYRAVNAVNEQLKPAIPIIMGGPGISRPRPEWLNPFFALYAADQDKGKRLDFVCYQSYGLLDAPIQAQSERSRVQSMLGGAGLNPATPVWVTEFGLYGGDTDGGADGRTPEEDLEHDQLVQAAGIAAVSRYYIIGKMNRPFQWVVHHGENLRKDMFVEGLDGVRLPFGHVVVMLGMLKPSLDGERLDMRISSLRGDDRPCPVRDQRGQHPRPLPATSTAHEVKGPGGVGLAKPAAQPRGTASRPPSGAASRNASRTRRRSMGRPSGLLSSGCPSGRRRPSFPDRGDVVAGQHLRPRRRRSSACPAQPRPPSTRSTAPVT
ncbi:glycosyl hydrolase [Nonomuraea sp. NPDC049709]|uniref:glycosyl hydrolase n=1 Tax=Nonomuraea sp. NPDC049709 TaxID=3154736 RepID=UPI0034440C49